MFINKNYVRIMEKIKKDKCSKIEGYVSKDILVSIFSFLSRKDLLSCHFTCRYWKIILVHPDVHHVLLKSSPYFNEEILSLLKPSLCFRTFICNLFCLEQTHWIKKHIQQSEVLYFCCFDTNGVRFVPDNVNVVNCCLPFYVEIDVEKNKNIIKKRISCDKVFLKECNSIFCNKHQDKFLCEVYIELKIKNTIFHEQYFPFQDQFSWYTKEQWGWSAENTDSFKINLCFLSYLIQSVLKINK